MTVDDIKKYITVGNRREDVHYNRAHGEILYRRK
jgi:hypothetical protein